MADFYQEVTVNISIAFKFEWKLFKNNRKWKILVFLYNVVVPNLYSLFFYNKSKLFSHLIRLTKISYNFKPGNTAHKGSKL